MKTRNYQLSRSISISLPVKEMLSWKERWFRLTGAEGFFDDLLSLILCEELTQGRRFGETVWGNAPCRRPVDSSDAATHNRLILKSVSYMREIVNANLRGRVMFSRF